MSHQFTRADQELEPQAGGSRSVGPPNKHTAAGVLDPPVPPIPIIPRSVLVRIFVVLVLLGIGATVFFLSLPSKGR